MKIDYSKLTKNKSVRPELVEGCCGSTGSPRTGTNSPRMTGTSSSRTGTNSPRTNFRTEK
ncbi:MAG: hypothetical protein PHQ03_02030 [Methylococcales bacterium]|nr:hypothetical protein [Methylococcales bacterium]